MIYLYYVMNYHFNLLTYHACFNTLESLPEECDLIININKKTVLLNQQLLELVQSLDKEKSHTLTQIQQPNMPNNCIDLTQDEYVITVLDHQEQQVQNIFNIGVKHYNNKEESSE